MSNNGPLTQEGDIGTSAAIPASLSGLLVVSGGRYQIDYFDLMICILALLGVVTEALRNARNFKVVL